jgi:hypothetical protein
MAFWKDGWEETRGALFRVGFWVHLVPGKDLLQEEQESPFSSSGVELAI